MAIPGRGPAHGEGAAGPGPGARPPQLNCLPFHPPCDESWASRAEGACLPAGTPGARGDMGEVLSGGPPPGSLQGDIHQDRPLFPQAGVPGSSVGASTVFKVKLQEHDRSLTLDPSLLTASKLGLFLISVTFIGEKAAQQSHTIPCHAKAPGWGLDLRRQPREVLGSHKPYLDWRAYNLDGTLNLLARPKGDNVDGGCV